MSTEILNAVSLVASAAALLIAIQRNRYMSRQMALASMIKMMEWMEEVRPKRLLLYEIGLSRKAYDLWSDDDKSAAEEVARRFDMLGVLENCGYLDKRVVDRFYAIPARKMWEICLPHVRAHQDRRGKWLFWEFEQLAERVKHVEKNHPGVRETRGWQWNPRRLRR